MDESAACKFSTHLEFEQHFQEVIARSFATLQLFDPDFAVFPLGSSQTDAALRQFLAGGGSIMLAMHRSAHIERHYPRFLRLVKDYSHKVACRITSKNIAQLSDSFCIGDAVHIVRRFHCDHMRGEAAFDAPAATEISLDRFAGIWADTASGLHPTTTGL